MLRLPSKKNRRCPSAAPATKRGGAQKHHSPPDFRQPLMLQVLRLPPRTSRRCPSVAPATQNETTPESITRRQTSAELYIFSIPSAAPATQNEPEVLQVLRLPRKNEPEVLQVLRLPRKTSRRCSKCCACHAKQDDAQKHHSSPDFRRPLCHAKRN